MKISKKENAALIKIKKQKIKIVLNVPKNNECFECSNSNPEFISLNNGIFLCKNCVKHHSNYPKTISNILKNDLNNLTLKNIQYLCFGGNEKLKQFIQVDYPILKKCSFQNLYKTYAMDYYRKYLEYLIEGGIKPNKPNKIKSCELLKTNKITNTIKKKNHAKINNLNNYAEETNSKNNKRNQNSNLKYKQLKITKSSGKHRPNLNLILSNFNNSLNNFNTINIYNYNDKIITETYYKKRFLSQIFKNININNINDSYNLTDINNITFNKEENNNKKLKSKSKKKEEKKLDKLEKNIKIIKRKDFLDKQYINLEKDTNIYEKPLFQNYVNTCHNKKIQNNLELSSTDLKYFSNDISEMKINTRNSFANKNLYSSQKIFKKKTVGNSFSIQYKKQPISTTNNSIIKSPKLQEENINIRNSNKNKLKNKLIFEINDSSEENGIIKVNRQINVKKIPKRHSLNNIILENKYDINNFNETEKEKKHRFNFNNEQKSKIIERIRRVASNKKGKNINPIEKENKMENKIQNEKVIINRRQIKNDQKNQTIKKNNTSFLIKDMVNQPTNIKRNILEIIKRNNLSNLIITPNSKKNSSIFTDQKSITKKDFEKKIIMKELYQRKENDIL